MKTSKFNIFIPKDKGSDYLIFNTFSKCHGVVDENVKLLLERLKEWQRGGYSINLQSFVRFCFPSLAHKLPKFIPMKFLRCEIIHIDDYEYEAGYYKNAENNGGGNYSVEIAINSSDKIILDDLS